MTKKTGANKKRFTFSNFCKFCDTHKKKNGYYIYTVLRCLSILAFLFLQKRLKAEKKRQEEEKKRQEKEMKALKKKFNVRLIIPR